MKSIDDMDCKPATSNGTDYMMTFDSCHPVGLSMDVDEMKPAAASFKDNTPSFRDAKQSKPPATFLKNEAENEQKPASLFKDDMPVEPALQENTKNTHSQERRQTMLQSTTKGERSKQIKTLPRACWRRVCKIKIRQEVLISAGNAGIPKRRFMIVNTKMEIC